jgi:hypothetical protein
MVLAFLMAWLIREQPLRKTVETSAGLGESLGAPVDTDSLREVTRGLTRLAGRERTLEFIAGATRRAGVDLEPGPAWLLLAAGAPDATGDITEIRARPHVPDDRFDAALAVLRERGCVDDDGALTPAGHALRDRLVAARTDCLRGLVDDWEPESRPELDPLIARLAQELATPPREPTPTA